MCKTAFVLRRFDDCGVIKDKCIIKETLIKAFPAPDLRREAAHSFANPCASAGGSKEAMI